MILSAHLKNRGHFLPIPGLPIEASLRAPISVAERGLKKGGKRKSPLPVDGPPSPDREIKTSFKA